MLRFEYAITGIKQVQDYIDLIIVIIEYWILPICRTTSTNIPITI